MGVGTAAVDIAGPAPGGKVIAVDRGASRLDICRELGAAAVIDFDTEDVKNRIKEITESGANVRYSTLLGVTFRSRRCGRRRGAVALSCHRVRFR